MSHDLGATDSVIIAGYSHTTPEWKQKNPRQAAIAFAAEDSQFKIEEPEWLFNEGAVREHVTYWPAAFIRRVAP